MNIQDKGALTKYYITVDAIELQINKTLNTP